MTIRCQPAASRARRAGSDAAIEDAPPSESGEAERGSGTVLALALVGAIVVIAGFLAALGLAHQARWQALTAADLAALAAATAIRTGFDPCEVAGATAGRNQASVRVCDVREAGQVLVVAEARLRWPAALRQLEPGGLTATGTARAGPR